MTIYLFRQIRFLMTSFLERFRLVAFLLVFLLSGCSTVGDYLSGSSPTQTPSFSYPGQLSPIHIGQTTKDEVRQMLGEPMDVQVATGDGRPHESWAYPSSQDDVHPFQYVMGFGVLALPSKDPPASFAVSFNDLGIVQGITLRGIQSFGSPSISPYAELPSVEVSPFGSNNPLVRQGYLLTTE
jgi:outer membrane protein assembly factor BamE (lipoprotein component of BamABCDE complex)